ncbi:isopeptide-forming domain-containing fimbrial protein [Listeria fleischmannii]|uniref:isopeptide-forming domain-containing fimbrial protein n=1 Tax=Listeria fleischmannii TaxID=1069827 RepID=UPI0002BB828A|nr:isopeptide-forming domain-containing fimbrial protein [Listeria fleischmannii]EMG26662.1 cell surface protein [Listeria fleischmannii subsp. fleischmannii LU2006-1]
MDHHDVKQNEEVTYTIEATNSLANTTLHNIRVSDPLPAGVELVPGSLKVDGQAAINEGDPGQIKTVIPEINGNQTVPITFKAKVTQATDGTITNIATLVDPADESHPQKPQADIQVVDSKGLLKSNKKVDHHDVKQNEEVTYTIEATNSLANTTLHNIRVSDPLPAGVELVPGSVKVDGQAAINEGDPGQIKTVIPEIKGNQTVPITFKAKVTQGTDGTITNIATLVDPADESHPQKPEVDIQVKSEIKTMTKDEIKINPIKKLPSTGDYDNKISQPFGIILVMGGILTLIHPFLRRRNL